MGIMRLLGPLWRLLSSVWNNFASEVNWQRGNQHLMEKSTEFIMEQRMEGLVIRDAKVTDMPAVYSLVCELAVFEEAPDSVLTTVEEYVRDFRNGGFRCLVADLAGSVVGIALYFQAYSTWKGRILYLDDLVVTKPCRGRGVGQALFDAFLVVAEREGCRLVKWQVLDWNEAAVRFYERNKALIERNWWNVKMVLRE